MARAATRASGGACAFLLFLFFPLSFLLFCRADKGLRFQCTCISSLGSSKLTEFTMLVRPPRDSPSPRLACGFE